MEIEKRAVIKYGAGRGGKDSAGSPKHLRAKYWAKNLFQTLNMDHEIVHLEFIKQIQSQLQISLSLLSSVFTIVVSFDIFIVAFSKHYAIALFFSSFILLAFFDLLV